MAYFPYRSIQKKVLPWNSCLLPYQIPSFPFPLGIKFPICWWWWWPCSTRFLLVFYLIIYIMNIINQPQSILCIELKESVVTKQVNINDHPNQICLKTSTNNNNNDNREDEIQRIDLCDPFNRENRTSFSIQIDNNDDSSDKSNKKRSISSNHSPLLLNTPFLSTSNITDENNNNISEYTVIDSSSSNNNPNVTNNNNNIKNKELFLNISGQQQPPSTFLLLSSSSSITPPSTSGLLRDKNGSYLITEPPTKLSPPPPPPPKTPKLGFGNFHYPNEEDNYDDVDDEEYDDGTMLMVDDNYEINNNNNNNNNNNGNDVQPSISLSSSSSSSTGKRINNTYSNNMNNSNDYDPYLDIFNGPKIERISIVGDRDKLPSADNYLMQPVANPVVDFVGCYCDHHYPPFSVSPLIFCYCFGESITEIPRNFSKSVRKIVLKGVGLKVLRAGVFQLYSNLTEIYMQTMHQLYYIEPGAFSNLPNLMSIYIKMAPKLKKIVDGVFVGVLLKLMHLKITHSGLERLPKIHQDNPNNIISMIDFDNSRIRNLTGNSIMVNAESLYIEYNQIEFIKDYAFNGSKIEKLSLKGNKKLVHLDEHAFADLYLRELDLSETSITKLPTNGLSESLEILRIANTFTLKEIPFIYHFESMKEAHLTYPYHCCAFQYPANHDPIEYERIKNLFNTDKYCLSKKINNNNMNRNKRNFDGNQFLPLQQEQEETFVDKNYDLNFTPNVVDQNEDDGISATRLFGKFSNFDADQFEKQHRIKRRDTIVNETTMDKFKNKKKMKMDNKTDGQESQPIYGYESKHPSSKSGNPTLSPYEILENRIHEENSGFPIDSKNLFKSNFKLSSSSTSSSGQKPKSNSNNNNNNQLPGKFGTPHASFSPKQEFCGDIENRMPIVRCYPTPDAFNPCEDVMGKNYLRVIVWFVAFAAVSGNVAVIVVLMSSRFTFNVSKFLMINLSIADLMMGVYLFIIAIVDLRTKGVYFNYAIDWQHGLGCKIAGFITVFAQLLSIFTLTVITLERLFAITYAIQLNRRLKLNLAVKVMIAGWFIVILLASLPLFGISSYSKTSICLPMEHGTVTDIIYLVSLLVINQLAFIIICACYSKMYFSIISQKTRATMNDMTIAKRMALLVFTDFACWAPIAFFGLTAIAGYPLIDVTNSKILLVTIYPLNSCANPFLYVIFTKQYRRDFFILVSRYGLCKNKALRYKPTRHLNHQMDHHHYHHRNHRHNSGQNTSDTPKSNPCMIKIHQGSSCPIQSFDSSHINFLNNKKSKACRGHQHHHCILHHCSDQCFSCHNLNSCSVSTNHGCDSHHGCSETENCMERTDNEAVAGSASLCLKFDSHSDSQLSNKTICLGNKHRKHKRCHHYYQSYYQRHECTRSPNESSGGCCPGSAVFSPVDIYPEAGIQNGQRLHLGIKNRNNRSNENSSNGKAEKDSADTHNGDPKDSSSCEKVHIIRNSCKYEANGGMVIFTRGKSEQNVNRMTSMDKARNGGKRGSILQVLLHRLSISKRLTQATESSVCESNENSKSSESGSPYSSNSSHHRNHSKLLNAQSHSNNHHHHCHRHHCYHHHHCQRFHHKKKSISENKKNHIDNNNGNDENPCSGNLLPMEEQREILRQALQETTTIQEAVAVVEELSSGARISMASSSSSKKA